MLFARAWMEALSFRKRHNRWRNTWQTQPMRISRRGWGGWELASAEGEMNVYDLLFLFSVSPFTRPTKTGPIS